MKTFVVLLAAMWGLVGLAPVSHAKPKIAVLGLEVIDNGSVDKKTTEAAQQLADELRTQAIRDDSKYSLAPDSRKDLLEMKLLSDCSDEGRSCMANIGKDLGADRLLYGKVERRKKGYQVSLKLLNTNTKQMEKTTSELIPIADLHNSKINKWSLSLYSRLIGMPESGTLSIDANVDKATIYIDSRVATTLRDGAAKVLGLDEGTHTLAIEADGYERYEAQVAITAGSTEALSVILLKQDSIRDDGDDEGSGGVWKVAFVTGVLVTGGMASGWTYNWWQYRGDLKQDQILAWEALKEGNPEAYGAISAGASPGSSVNESCGKAARFDGEVEDTLTRFRETCKKGESAATRATLFATGTTVAALATAYFGYQGWVIHGDMNSKERSASAKTRSKKQRVIITPQVSEHSVGAGLSLEF